MRVFISNSVLSLRCFRYNRFWGGQNHLVYIGDSRVRQLYSAAVAWVEQEAGRPLPTAPPTPASLDRAGQDDTWQNSAQNLKLDFFWAPTVNETLFEVSYYIY